MMMFQNVTMADNDDEAGSSGARTSLSVWWKNLRGPIVLWYPGIFAFSVTFEKLCGDGKQVLQAVIQSIYLCKDEETKTLF